MRITEIVDILPTQFRRTTNNPLHSGHLIPKLGYWTEDDGYVNIQSLEFESEVLACPIIAIVDTKIGNKDLKLNITGKVAKYNNTSTRKEGDYNITRKLYEDSGTTKTTSFTIPRFTRPMATFLITGLGTKIFEITSVTTTVENEVGKVSFYALASNGSKILYWFGIHKIATQVREILRPWIVPTKCSRCGGTGIEPKDSTKDCYQCLGYKYSGYSSTAYVQKQLGFDVGLGREVLDWEDLSEADHTLIKKFINKCWTQKWWCTPTKKEIKRLFAHFYDVTTAAIYVTERFNAQEPVWSINLPEEGSEASAFGTFTTADRELMRYIARSVTPAGVSVFIGFYRSYELGNMDDFSDKLWLPFFENMQSALGHRFAQWGQPRWDFWNGWTEATDAFEREGALGWTSSGTVEIKNINDQNRHMCKFTDNAYIETGTVASSGAIDFWMHPQEEEFRAGILNASGDWMFYIKYNSDGFYDHNNNLLTKAMKDNDYHVSIDFNHSTEEYKVQVMKEQVGSYISYLNSGTQDKIRFQSIGTGNTFLDAVGLPDDSNYEKYDNVPRLYPMGYGINNLNYYVGASGTINNIFEEYYTKDKFFDINI